MNRTERDYLFRVEPPFVVLGRGEPERTKWIPQAFYSKPGLDVCVRRLRGWKMRTTSGLMTEFGAALQFFDNFGENWYALEDCLRYMDEWLPAQAYVLVVERAEELLAEEGDVASFLRTIEPAGEFWSHPVTGNGRFDRPSIPFHVLLNLSDDNPGSRNRFLDAAAKAGVNIRVE